MNRTSPAYHTKTTASALEMNQIKAKEMPSVNTF
jgi:hypothetical protein